MTTTIITNMADPQSPAALFAVREDGFIRLSVFCNAGVATSIDVCDQYGNTVFRLNTNPNAEEPYMDVVRKKGARLMASWWHEGSRQWTQFADTMVSIILEMKRGL